MIVVYGSNFERERQQLPHDIQQLLEQQRVRFERNHHDPRLHTKKLRGTEVETYSLRVTRNYRVLYFYKDGETAVWFDIDHRKDEYR